jgi:hypothetical protein
MFKKDNFIPPLSSFELRRQASIERNLEIQACTRAAVRASAKWLRMLLQRSTRLARDLTAERRRRNAIRELHRLDDRTLKDIVSTEAISNLPSATDCPHAGQAVSTPPEQRFSTSARG